MSTRAREVHLSLVGGDRGALRSGGGHVRARRLDGGARKRHTATVLESGQVLVVGGGVPPSADLETATAELQDPAANTFSATGSMVEARKGHTASVLESGDILVAGGNGNATGKLATAELPPDGRRRRRRWIG